MSDNDKNNTYSSLRFLGILVLVLFCLLLLIVSGFTRLKLWNCLQGIESLLHPDMFGGLKDIMNMRPYFYIPQVPVLAFITIILGNLGGAIVAFFYIVIGLFFVPIFGLGGGIDYVCNYSFGYLLGFIPAALFGCKTSDYSFISLFKKTAVLILILHLTGAVYMIINALIQRQTFEFIADWLLFESLIRLVYDFIFGVVAMIIAKYVKKFLWIMSI